MPEHWSQEVFDKWRADDGDYELRLKSHDLGPSPFIVELGTHLGDGTAALRRQWPDATILTFEPIHSFYLAAAERFKNDPYIHTFNVGLGPKAGFFQMTMDGYGSCISVDGQEVVEIMCPDDVFAGVTNIALMEMNIEGAEYDLLDHMLDNGWTNRIRNLQVQFHDVLPDAYARMIAIRERLAETHTQTYCYDFVFENWRRND